MAKVDATKSSSGFSKELKAYLDEQFIGLHKENGQTKQSLEEIKERLDLLENDGFKVTEECDHLSLREQNSALRNQVQDLKWQLDQIDAYTRQDNLRFYNIPESANENTEQVLATFIGDKLGLDPARIMFSVVHRLGQWQDNNNRRCIIARFVRRVDVSRVKAAAVKLAGTRFGISEDLPASWAELRKKAHSTVVKPAREAGKKVRWRGRRLFINGKEVSPDKPTPIKSTTTSPARTRNQHKATSKLTTPSDSSSDENDDEPRSQRQGRKKRLNKRRQHTDSTGERDTGPEPNVVEELASDSVRPKRATYQTRLQAFKHQTR